MHRRCTHHNKFQTLGVGRPPSTIFILTLISLELNEAIFNCSIIHPHFTSTVPKYAFIPINSQHKTRSNKHSHYPTRFPQLQMQASTQDHFENLWNNRKWYQPISLILSVTKERYISLEIKITRRNQNHFSRTSMYLNI